MTGPHLIIEGNFSDRALFSRLPYLTIRQAFADISKSLPSSASVTFCRHSRNAPLVVRIQPIAEKEEPRLSYQFFPEHHSVLIRRIHSGPVKRSGLGTAMIASQYPFWARMDVTSVAVPAHGISEGFYRKLGFETVPSLQEYPDWIFIPMVLNLRDSAQKEVFEHALQKTGKMDLILCDLKL